MTPAPTLLAGYLLAVLIPLLYQNPNFTGALFAAAHVGIAAVLLRRAGPERERIDAWAWVPPIAVPFLYAELPLLNQWRGSGYFDGVVHGWEVALFHTDPSVTWAGAMPWLPLSEVLHAGYLAYYPLIYLPFVALHVTGRSEGFHRGTRGLLLAFMACYVVFIVFPVQGPRYLNAAPPGIPLGPVRRTALAILQSASSRGAAFPSSHVAVGVAQALLVWRWFGRRWGVFVAAVTLALACGAVYGGFHYAIDAAVGACLGVAAFTLSGAGSLRPPRLPHPPA